jgi:NAD(P)-dependent dehydrogenase (short-subunit alcohol dehydrogenase family)
MNVVLITGCSSGFGRAAAEAFARRGDQVVATMRNPSRATATGGRAEGLDQVEGVVIDQLDVVDAESRAGAVARTLERFGRIDVLVNNAGVSALGPTEELTDQVFRDQFETNFFGPFDLMKEVLPSMRANQAGRIVNVTSIGALLTPGFYGGYCATKHALDALSLALDIELQPYGIRVVTVVPGGYSTSMVSNLIPTERPDTAYPRARLALEEYAARMVGKEDLTPVIEAILAAATDADPHARYLVGTGTTELLRTIVAEGEMVHAELRARDAV